MIIGIDASRANRVHKTGTEWYAYYLIRWLAKLDSKNEYILYTDEPLVNGLVDLTTEQFYKDENDCQQETNYDEQGYQKLKSPYNNFRAKVLKWPFSFFWTQGRLSLEMLCCKPDILFVPSHTLPIIHPKNSVVTIHDIGFERDYRFYDKEEIYKGGKLRRKILDFFVFIFTKGKYKANSIDYLRWSTEFTLKNASRIISVSNFSKKEIVDFYKIKEDKIKVIYNGYNRLLYKKNLDEKKTKEVLNRYGIEKPYFFYIGRIEKKKNTPNLIESFALMCGLDPSIKENLVLVGNASFGYDEVKYVISSYDIQERIFMPGWVAEVDVPYIFQGATAFVFPSRYEGFGIPLLQAMATGVPIISSNTASMPEVVQDSAIFINPDNRREIADAMIKISYDEKLRKELIEKGFEVVKNFSWEKTAKETLDYILS